MKQKMVGPIQKNVHETTNELKDESEKFEIIRKSQKIATKNYLDIVMEKKKILKKNLMML